jgi:hypothetical protein
VPGWRLSLGAVAVFCLGGLVAIAAVGKWSGSPSAVAPGAATHWAEIAWPFPIDEWGRGKALHCPASRCGAEIEIYLRPKIGFCNCTSGVADDLELDRVSDFGLMGDGIAPLGEGKPIQVGSMMGRARAFRVDRAGKPRMAITTAFNNNCDVIVATAIVDRRNVETAQEITLESLNSEYVVGWAKRELGL